MKFSKHIEDIIMVYTRGKQPSSRVKHDIENEIHLYINRFLHCIEKPVTITLNPICEGTYVYNKNFIVLLKSKYPEYLI